MANETARGVDWLDDAGHHRWLRDEGNRLLSFHERHALGSPTGFAQLDSQGVPESDRPRELYFAARMVHCFSLADLLGRPGARAIAEHGLAALRGPFSDRAHGGWFASVDPGGDPLDTSKGAYGHAFVLLAASTATVAGLPGADDLLAESAGVLDDHFRDADEDASPESFTADWTPTEPEFRGQNANMHLVEALLAACEATGERRFQRRAESIASLLIERHAAANGWRVPEYYDAAWKADPSYNADKPGDPFRPYGSLPGHSLEWARLLVQLANLPGSAAPWAVDAAVGLFDTAMRDGWTEPEGGLPYTVDAGGRVANPHRMHWVMAEAVGAAVHLARATGEQRFADWYRRFWSYIQHRLIDPVGGSWWHEVDARGEPASDTWPGKPDLYHAYQSTLFARAPVDRGLALAARSGLID